MDAELWGPAAKVIAERAVKGTTILVKGPLEQENFEGKDGTKKTRYKLRVEFFQLGDKSVSPATKGSGSTPSEDEDAPF